MRLYASLSLIKNAFFIKLAMEGKLFQKYCRIILFPGADKRCRIAWRYIYSLHQYLFHLIFLMKELPTEVLRLMQD